MARAFDSERLWGAKAEPLGLYFEFAASMMFFYNGWMNNIHIS
jgi:hypothetical protein